MLSMNDLEREKGRKININYFITISTVAIYTVGTNGYYRIESIESFIAQFFGTLLIPALISLGVHKLKNKKFDNNKFSRLLMWLTIILLAMAFAGSLSRN